MTFNGADILGQLVPAGGRGRALPGKTGMQVLAPRRWSVSGNSAWGLLTGQGHRDDTRT